LGVDWGGEGWQANKTPQHKARKAQRQADCLPLGCI